MGISMGPILILNIMAENDSNMIDLVLTHLTHPWGPPWTLATLGDPRRPLATLGNMLENDHFGGNWPFSVMSPMVDKGRQGSPRFNLLNAKYVLLLVPMFNTLLCYIKIGILICFE